LKPALEVILDHEDGGSLKKLRDGLCCEQEKEIFEQFSIGKNF